MPSEYQYAPLATPSTIRVIKIEEQKVNNAVACIIRHVEQSEFEYEALSYVWGDPKPTRHVYLGNEADQRNLFPIHENLGRFLNWAWGRRMFDRWIWTDRISLNQDDSEEMAQQIPIMGKIYQNAKQSLTWLGMSEKDGEHMESFEPRGHKGKGSNSTAKNAKLAARRVQSNEYWGRIWMAQEISCAKRVAVWIGNWELEFESLHTTLGQFEKDEDFPIDKQFLLRQGGGESELLQMLLWVTESGFESSRPQDRVYGLLGLVAANSDGTSPVDHIEIDYNKPESEPNSWRTELMLDPHRIEAACGKYKGWGSCDGSVMIFEIAELGFRLAFQFNDYEDAFMFMHFRLPKPEEEEEEREERQDTTK
ncbi:heterokaryon incompatibility protein-domain-containing protein [Phyllosticta citricarpa]|uniref:Heterokaryon incompatibility protein-domain-containing protein n=2 Tax=Phyllosticta TaxID=121621 RepID=A0ABR1LK29_9PEZI